MMIKKYISGFLFIVLLILSACQQSTSSENSDYITNDSLEATEFERNREAREDSLELVEAYELMNKSHHIVTAIGQTKAVDEDAEEDAADDPAFWFNEANPDSSIVYGSNKQGGIYAYSLSGAELAYYPIGLVNNIDVRKDVIIAGSSYDIIGGSNRTDNSVFLYQINSNGELEPLITSHKIDTTDVNEVYGFCMYKSDEGTGYAIVNGKNGRINSYEIVGLEGDVHLELHKSWKLDTQPEGMVADDTNGDLFIGEEEYGIWKVSLKKESEPMLIPSSSKRNNPDIEYDIEGLAIYRSGTASERNFLLASIQGSFNYAIFSLEEDHEYITNFRIGDSSTIDMVEETDGLEIVSQVLGANYPNGLLIVQDGFNKDESGKLIGQNFKMVDLESVKKLLGGD